MDRVHARWRVKIGVFCQAWPEATRADAKGWQAVVTLALVKALCAVGAEAFPVVWDSGEHPLMDHAIVVTEECRNRMLEDEAFCAALRARVAGKVCFYIDGPILAFQAPFDLMFCGEAWEKKHVDSGFAAAHPKVRWVGFGADESFRPFQESAPGYYSTAVVQYPDPLVLERTEGEPWAMVRNVLRTLAAEGWTIHGLGFEAPWVATSWCLRDDPRARRHEWEEGIYYTGVSSYLPWRVLPTLYGCAAWYVDTRGGALDLSRIEATYAGAMLVVHETNYRAQVHGVLPHVVWKDEAQLAALLRQQPTLNRYAIAAAAREHAWPRVALRILAALTRGGSNA